MAGEDPIGTATVLLLKRLVGVHNEKVTFTEEEWEKAANYKIEWVFPFGKYIPELTLRWVHKERE